MEYQKYLIHFAELIKDKNLGFVEGHFDFSVDPNTPNPDYPVWRANDIESRIKRYQDPEIASPGIRYKREGIVFHVDMVAVKLEGHLDYFERAYTEIGLLFQSGLVPIQKTTRRLKSTLDT